MELSELYFPDGTRPAKPVMIHLHPYTPDCTKYGVCFTNSAGESQEYNAVINNEREYHALLVGIFFGTYGSRALSMGYTLAPLAKK